MRGRGFSSFLALLAMPFVLSGCPDGGCPKLYALRGSVVDGSTNLVAGVEVVYVTHYGFQSQIAVTDTNGSFDVSTGRYSDVGNSYLIFKKSGYADYSTQSEPIGGGDGTCADQVIVRDAVMVP